MVSFFGPKWMALLSALLFLGCDGFQGDDNSAEPCLLLAPPIPLGVPGQPFTATAAFWSSTYNYQGLLADVLTINLLEGEKTCREDELALARGERALRLFVQLPSPGECTVRDTWGSGPFAPPPTGCTATAVLTKEPADGMPQERIVAIGGRFTLEREDDGSLGVEGHLVFSVSAPAPLSCTRSHHRCDCRRADGTTFTCDSRLEDVNCCDDEAATVDVDLKLVAPRCPWADFCYVSPCAPLIVSNTNFDPSLDCAAACSDFRSVCEDCTGFPGKGIGEEMDPCREELCIARCESGILSAPELASLSCLERGTNCEAWRSCMLD